MNINLLEPLHVLILSSCFLITLVFGGTAGRNMRSSLATWAGAVTLILAVIVVVAFILSISQAISP